MGWVRLRLLVYTKTGGGGGGRSVRLRLYTKTRGEGAGCAVGKLNELIRHSHARFSTKTQGTSRQTGPLRSAPALSCSTASLTLSE